MRSIRIQSVCGGIAACVLAYINTTILAQTTYQQPYLNHSAHLLTSDQHRFNQEEAAVNVQQLSIDEWTLAANKIKRQLEAISIMRQWQEEISDDLKKYASQKIQELNGYEKAIKASKESLAMDRELLKERKRWATAQEAASLPVSPVHQNYAERIKQQNEMIQKEHERQQMAIASQNQMLMTAELHRSEPIQMAPAPAPTVKFDTNELDLCKLLEGMASNEDYDIAEMNLRAAKGLPGAENLNIDNALKTLDLWAGWVRHETERHMYKYKNDPETFNNSEAYFRTLMMITVLQQDFKVRYHADPKMRAGEIEIDNVDYAFYDKPEDIFIHGLTGSSHQGTCASLPVLYVAVGRRLGYPLKLVTAKGHLFVRWDDGKERFNIEGTNRGLNCYPDKEYMEWPVPITDEELETGMWLNSLTPRRELAVFLELRALCYKYHGDKLKYSTTKSYADYLREKDGINLVQVNRLLREQHLNHMRKKADINDVLFSHIFTATNSWRYDIGYRRGTNEKVSIFYSDNTDTE